MNDTLTALRTALADRYRVERQVGAGGMATVYLAEDLKHHRQVAIKVLRPELAAAMGAERFRREIEIAASLHHPHILPLFDSGTTPAEVPGDASGSTARLYYVMPFEDGPTVRTRLESDGQLPVPTVTRLMREIAEALAHAHGRGVVHRDIKPENVLLSDQHALVTDFGIAKALASGQHPDDASGLSALTQVGTSIGTPTYMAPEQIAGDATTDHRADIYALGVMAYEMLAGLPPFTGSTSQQVLAGHLTGTPAPFAKHRSDVPPALEAIIMRCLAKDPAGRWQSATNLVSALAALESGGGMVSPTNSRLRRFWPIAAAVAVLIGAGGYFWYHQSGRYGTLIGGKVLAANDLVMVAEFANRTNDSTLAATVTDAVRIELQGSPVVRVLSQTQMYRGMTNMELTPGTTLSDSQLRELAERLGVKAFIVGDVAPLGKGFQLTARVVTTVEGKEGLVVLATAENEDGLIGAVSDLAHKLRSGIGESLRSVANAPTLANVTTTSLPALKAYTAGRRADDEGHRDRGIELGKQAVALDSTFAAAWNMLTVFYTNNNQNGLAREASEHAFRWREHLPELARLNLSANYFSAHGQFDSAMSVLRQATELHNTDWTSYADVLLNRGQLADAEVAARKGIVETPKEPVAYWNLVEAQVAQQKFAAVDSTLARMRDSLSPGNSWTAELVASAMAGRGEFDSLRSYLTSDAGKGGLGATPELCSLNLLQGMLAAWRTCLADPANTRVGPDPYFVMAELRLTGDSAHARQELARIVADTIHPSGGPILVAAYAELGMLTDARKALARWRTVAGADDPSYRLNLPYAEAAIALAEGKLDSAASGFLAWNGTGSVDASHIYNRGLVEAGMALDRGGKSDSAMALYQKALSMPSISGGNEYQLGWYPEVLRRLGELYEARGNKAEAIRWYGKLLDLWKGADPVLKPQVDAVRARVAALSGEH